MAGRIRTIKPELLEDEKTATLSHPAWRLFVSALLVADDYGNLRGAEDYIRGAIFWGRHCPDLPSCIRELVANGLFGSYSVNGQSYFHVRGWEKHQRVDKPGKPRCPSHVGQIRELVATDSRLTPTPTPTPTTDPDHTGSQDEPAPSAPAANESGPRAKKRRGMRLPADWSPAAETIAWAKGEGIADPFECLAEFRDYWCGIAGQKGVKLDWDATYRNRLRALLAEGRLRIRPKLVPIALPAVAEEPRMGATEMAELHAQHAALVARLSTGGSR